MKAQYRFDTKQIENFDLTISITMTNVQYSVSFSTDFDNENEAMIFAANMIKFITGSK